MSFAKQIVDNKDTIDKTAKRLCENRQDAKDLSQRVVERAINNEDKFKKGTNLAAWLTTITKNMFYNDRRQSSIRNKIRGSNNSYLVTQYNSGIENVQKHVEKHDVKEVLRVLKENLKPQFYRALYLTSIKDMTYKECAEYEDTTIGTMCSRMSRAKSKSKKILTKHFGKEYLEESM